MEDQFEEGLVEPTEPEEVAQPEPAPAPQRREPAIDPEEAIRRIVQSEVDKRVGKIQRRFTAVEDRVRNFDSTVDRFRKAGVLKEDVDVEHLRQAELANAFTEDTEEPEVQEQQPVQPQSQDPLYNEALRIAAQYGLEGTDPEVSLINTAGSPYEYLRSIDEAGKSKQKRLGGGRKVEPKTDAPVPSDIGVGAGDKPNPIADINDPTVLLEMGLYGKTKP